MEEAKKFSKDTFDDMRQQESEFGDFSGSNSYSKRHDLLGQQHINFEETPNFEIVKNILNDTLAPED